MISLVPLVDKIFCSCTRFNLFAYVCIFWVRELTIASMLCRSLPHAFLGGYTSNLLTYSYPPPSHPPPPPLLASPCSYTPNIRENAEASYWPLELVLGLGLRLGLGAGLGLGLGVGWVLGFRSTPLYPIPIAPTALLYVSLS